MVQGISAREIFWSLTKKVDTTLAGPESARNVGVVCLSSKNNQNDLQNLVTALDSMGLVTVVF